MGGSCHPLPPKGDHGLSVQSCQEQCANPMCAPGVYARPPPAAGRPDAAGRGPSSADRRGAERLSGLPARSCRGGSDADSGGCARIGRAS
eukprot:12804584-Alexandrium_andersonii.AAC.1